MTVSTPQRPRRISKNLALFALVATFVLAVAPVLQAQEEPAATKFTARTGSYGLYPGYMAHATLTETDPLAPASWVTLVFLDEKGVPLKRTKGVLWPDQPIRLPLSYYRAGGRGGKRIAVRVVAEVTSPRDGSLNSVILTMERYHSASGSLATGPECPVGSEGPAGPRWTDPADLWL